MRFLKFILTAVTLSAAAFTSFTASASPTDPKLGTEYKVLPTPQPVDTGKKVEVIEFFDYACPHCAGFDAPLNAWVKKQGDNIVLKRVHIGRQGTDLPQEKMFYTLQAMGALTPELHTKIFNEMHVNHNRMNRDELVFDFVAKEGVDKQKFIDTYRGFGIVGHLRKAQSMMDAYNVEFWPYLVVDGKYVTAPSMALANATTEAQLNDAVTQVLDVLVIKAKAEKK